MVRLETQGYVPDLDAFADMWEADIREALRISRILNSRERKRQMNSLCADTEQP